MWSKPIIRKTPDGREVAVLLVDTQGTFDNQTTAEVNAMVFALNALISSFQVYNISKRIGEGRCCTHVMHACDASLNLYMATS